MCAKKCAQLAVINRQPCICVKNSEVMNHTTMYVCFLKSHVSFTWKCLVKINIKVGVAENPNGSITAWDV